MKKINVSAINAALQKTAGPQVIVSPSGKSVRIIWPDGAEESSLIPEKRHTEIITALAEPDSKRPSGATNKDYAVGRIFFAQPRKRVPENDRLD